MNEDREGRRPFIGESGEKLRVMLIKAQLPPERISLANVINCRATKVVEEERYGRLKKITKDDEPTPAEVKNCYDNLEGVIKMVNPKVIIAAGGCAMKRLIGGTGIQSKNGLILRSSKYPNAVIVPMFHPAYVGRNPGAEPETIQALITVRRYLDGEIKVKLGTYRAAETIEQFREMMDELEASSRFSMDIEGSGLVNFQEIWITSMAFSTIPGTGWVLPWRIGTKEFYEAVWKDRNSYKEAKGTALALKKRPSKIVNVFDFAKKVGVEAGFDYYWKGNPEVRERLGKLLASPKHLKIFHNAPFDMKVLRNKQPYQGFTISAPHRDTLVEHYLIDETKGTHSLDYLSSHYLDMGDYKKIINEWIVHSSDGENEGDSYAIIPWHIGKEYNGGDADATLRLADFFEPQLQSRQVKLRRGGWDMLYFLDNFMMPVQQMLVDAEEWGVKIDMQAVEAGERLMDQQIVAKKKELTEACGVVDVNLGSTKQLIKIFYEQLHFPILKKTEKGQPSTDDETLNELMKKVKHPAPKLLSEYRTLDKLQGTYVKGMRNKLFMDGRLHALFNLTTTDTGRLSSARPNLQNIPRPREGEVNIRRFFVPSEPGWKIVCADYSQAELRVLAFIANDKAAIQRFVEGRDPHNETAAAVFGLPPGVKAKKEQRVVAKRINFRIPYGSTAQGIAEQLTKEDNRPTSLAEAEEFIKKFFIAWPDAEKWFAATKQHVHDFGYVESYFGRRNHIKFANSPQQSLRNEAERKAINMPIQSLASDITLMSASTIWNEVKRRGLNNIVHLWSLVHDSILFEVREDFCIPFMRDLVYPKMTKWVADHFGFPFECDLEMGDRWGECDAVCPKCWKTYKDEHCPVCS